MTIGLALDREAIAVACRSHHVKRLTVFGSAVSARFDPHTSDVDFMVEFAPAIEDAFDAYFGLKEDLETLIGHRVDLIMASAVRNPHLAASAASHTEEVYAA